MAPSAGAAYHLGMKFTFEPFWVNPKGELEPLFPVKPITLELASVEAAREMFGKVLGHPDFPAHSIKLTSEDGSTSERWFQIDGQWRRKDA